jgi:hypothetical protein
MVMWCCDEAQLGTLIVSGRPSPARAVMRTVTTPRGGVAAGM